MIATVVLAIVGAWLLLSVITAVACAAVARGGLREDRARGYAPPQAVPEQREPAVHR